MLVGELWRLCVSFVLLYIFCFVLRRVVSRLNLVGVRLICFCVISIRCVLRLRLRF